MEGFIYVVGLSHDIISKLIDIEYKESAVKGEQYIKKIIQIPITLPKWNKEDINDLVINLVEKGIIDKSYKEIIEENIDLISIAIEHNPREIKRFLNNFIVAFEIFSTIKNFDAKGLLIIQAIQIRWNNFYHLLLSSDDQFRNELIKYSKMNEEERMNILDTEVKKDEKNVREGFNQNIRKILSNFKSDSELWSFLTKNIEILDKISNWNIYRRATEISTDPTINTEFTKILEWIKDSNIEYPILFEECNKSGREFMGLDEYRNF
jgi:polyhydroxyalkanoate synthesis regulator phasin